MGPPKENDAQKEAGEEAIVQPGKVIDEAAIDLLKKLLDTFGDETRAA